MRAQSSNRGTLVTGLVLLGVGLFWFLRKLGIVFPDWMFQWPMILIIVGVAVGIQHKFSNPVSYILVALGVLFLLEPMLNLPQRLYEFFWPSILVGLGIVVLLNYVRGSGRKKEYVQGDFRQFTSKVSETTTTDGGRLLIKEVCVFGEQSKSFSSQDFAGGETTTLFGSTSLYFNEAKLTGPALLNATVAFGDLKIYVPADWAVENRVQAILGSAKDKRMEPAEGFNPVKKLVLSGTALFGEVSVKSLR
jgi:predicted membrane protein